MAHLVVQLNPRAQRPVAGVAALFQFDVLRTGAGNQQRILPLMVWL